MVICQITQIMVSIPGDAIKRDPERENCALLTIAAQTANSIHIRVTFNAVTRYVVLGKNYSLRYMNNF